MKKPLIAILITALLVSVGSGLIFVKDAKANPKTIFVPDDYPTIAAAIGNAVEGDTIFIKSGTYEGPINQTIVIDRSISLIGENAENTIVNLHPKYNVTRILTAEFYDYSDAIQIEANDVKLENLKLHFIGNMLSNGDRVRIVGNDVWSQSTATGIYLSGNECIITRNTFLGIISANGSSNSITENNAHSLSLHNANHNYVHSNLLQAFWLDSSDDNVISNNNVTTLNVMYAAYVTNSSNNTFNDNYIGASLWNTNLEIGYKSTNNTFCNNAFIDVSSGYDTMYANENLSVIDSSSYNNSWDNGFVGNYWSNYLLRYPNASEIDSSGIGNTPYAIDENNTDRYPLMKSNVAVPNLPSPSPTPTSSLTPTPSPSSSPPTTRNNTIIDGNTNANVTIQSPENKTYNQNNVTLAFTVESDVKPIENFSPGPLFSFFRHGVVLDYNTSKLADIITDPNDYHNKPDNISTTFSSPDGHHYVGNANLTNLSEGPHNLTVWIRDDYSMISYSYYEWAVLSTVSFAIDITPPIISDLFTNSSYHEGGICLLAFTVNEPTSWLGYSLDNKANVTITSNTTLTGLTVGTHYLTVYANDTAGNMGKADFVFYEGDILTPTPSPTQQPILEPSQSATITIGPIVDGVNNLPYIIGIIIVVIVAITIVGLAVYLTKYRKKKTAN